VKTAQSQPLGGNGETGSLVIGKTGNMQLEPDVALEPVDGVGAERGSDRGPGQLWQLGREQRVSVCASGIVGAAL
jgi:hypothetical protein